MALFNVRSLHLEELREMKKILVKKSRSQDWYM
jgi:hypothetical protein